MRRHTRQGPRWWHIGVPVFVLGGLLVLEPQAPLSPGGHKVAQLVIALLMYGMVMYWLRRNRGALIHEAYEREKAQEDTRRTRQREIIMRDHESWDDAELPWQHKRHSIDR